MYDEESGEISSRHTQRFWTLPFTTRVLGNHIIVYHDSTINNAISQAHDRQYLTTIASNFDPIRIFPLNSINSPRVLGITNPCIMNHHDSTFQASMRQYLHTRKEATAKVSPVDLALIFRVLDIPDQSPCGHYTAQCLHMHLTAPS